MTKTIKKIIIYLLIVVVTIFGFYCYNKAQECDGYSIITNKKGYTCRSNFMCKTQYSHMASNISGWQAMTPVYKCVPIYHFNFSSKKAYVKKNR